MSFLFSFGLLASARFLLEGMYNCRAIYSLHRDFQLSSASIWTQNSTSKEQHTIFGNSQKLGIYGSTFDSKQFSTESCREKNPLVFLTCSPLKPPIELLVNTHKTGGFSIAMSVDTGVYHPSTISTISICSHGKKKSSEKSAKTLEPSLFSKCCSAMETTARDFRTGVCFLSHCWS